MRDSLFLNLRLCENMNLSLCGEIWCCLAFAFLFIEEPPVFVDLIEVHAYGCISPMTHPTTSYKLLQYLTVRLLTQPCSVTDPLGSDEEILLGAAQYDHDSDLRWRVSENVEDDIGEPLRDDIGLVGLVVLFLFAVEMQGRGLVFWVCHIVDYLRFIFLKALTHFLYVYYNPDFWMNQILA